MLELLAAGGGILDDLGINIKVLGVQVVIFILTFILLSNLLFKRVLRFMKEREHEQESAAERIRRNQEEVARLTREYEAKIAEVEKQAYARLQDILKEALEAKSKIVTDAQGRARIEVEAARQSIAAEKARAMDQLKSEVVRLSKEAAERILGEPVDEAAVRKAMSK